MNKYINLGKKIYNTANIKEYKRMIVFVARSLLHDKFMNKIINFFDETPIKKAIIAKEPFFIEILTRQVLFKNSTFEERYKIITNHFNIILNKFNELFIEKVYLNNGIKLWEEDYNGKKLYLKIDFESGQKKEGLMSLMLKLDDIKIYQMIFWIGYDKSKQESLFIGAMQGSNETEANKLIKDLTKYFYGYRTKNLILYMTRIIVKSLGIKKIYAISNKGYYANNHIRIDRKLKTSLDVFWEETGGIITNDNRFYELPIEEFRKKFEEVKTHKRSQYRNRFNKLDEVESKIIKNINFFKQ